MQAAARVPGFKSEEAWGLIAATRPREVSGPQSDCGQEICGPREMHGKLIGTVRS